MADLADPMMLSQRLDGTSAWTAATVDAPACWHYALDAEGLTELERLFRETRGRRDEPVTGTRIDGGLPACARCLRPALEALERGRGFVIIDRPPASWSPEQQIAACWMLGQLLGSPFEQDVAGTLLFDVHDTGQSVTEGARFSVTNAESSFHTDSAFNPNPPDYVGLLCLQTARTGGESQLISGLALHDELLTHHPRTLRTLYRSFCFDRRGQFLEGEPEVLENPVFSWDGRRMLLRYLHYYIEVGHEKTRRPLGRDQREALDLVEGLVRNPQLRVEFQLQQGQMLFTNNRWILHNRTTFEDHAEPASRRHYVRLWLRTD